MVGIAKGSLEYVILFRVSVSGPPVVLLQISDEVDVSDLESEVSYARGEIRDGVTDVVLALTDIVLDVPDTVLDVIIVLNLSDTVFCIEETMRDFSAVASSFFDAEIDDSESLLAALRETLVNASGCNVATIDETIGVFVELARVTLLLILETVPPADDDDDEEEGIDKSCSSTLCAVL